MKTTKLFHVTFVEINNGRKRRIEQNCYARDRQEVISWYGLNEPDIVSYRIEEIS